MRGCKVKRSSATGTVSWSWAEGRAGGIVNSEAAAALFRKLDRELWLVTASAGGRRGGLIATFVSQASIVPELPRTILGLAKQHHTWGLIEASGVFALHLMGEEQLDWVWRFGLQSG